MNFLRQLVKQLICLKWVNGIIRFLIYPIKTHLPHAIMALIEKIPVVGTIPLQLAGLKQFYVAPTREQADMFKYEYWSGKTRNEPHVLAVIQDVLPYVKIVMDVGANVGWYTLILAASESVEKVYAFEPLPSVFDHLQRSVAVNNFDKVMLVAEAVGEIDGTITLYAPTDMLTTMASTKEIFKATHYPDNFVEYRVPVLKLDMFAKRYNIQSVDFIKLDVENAEDAVIRGALNLIQRSQPIIICEVLPEEQESPLNGLFQNSEYEFYNITPQGLKKYSRICNTPHWNWLLVTSQKYQQMYGT
jgi:FkbM family methyltransferase